ncbi:MAG: DUF4783 domain-containing protein [Bacteroidia bacterium]|nr:DUF4783 domain-containing protein [Bacteroidia bacterium]MCZ2276424.1 DUF4783 domain-containing protein [Bacteroidia bacterium]
MKPIYSILIILFCTSFIRLEATADIFDDLTSVIRSGDSRQISRYFGSNVDLTILSSEEVYSKAQAEQVLKDFFTKNPPRSFNFIHKGLSKDGAKYAIGSYVSTQGASYRTYIFIKTVNGSEIIQELRFEKD